MPADEAAIIPASPGDGEARARLREAFARLRAAPGPVLLFVSHDRGGGVARHVADLAALLAGRAAVLVLEPWRRSWLALRGTGEYDGLRLWLHRERDGEGLAACLRAAGVARVHFHHVQGHAPSILDLPRVASCAYDVTIHDYFAFCPQYQLVDERGAYCGEPDEAGCRACLGKRPAAWPLDIAGWRARFGPWLAGAARVIAPSRDAAGRIARRFPGLAPLAWPHPELAGPALARRKVVVPGGLSPAKGMARLLDCARDAKARSLPLVFRVAGHVALPLPAEEALPLSFTGEFPEGALDALLEEERPDVFFFPAQWPETYSYTLSAALRARRPIVATDLGAFPERLDGRADARIVPWKLPAGALNDALLEAAGGAPVSPATGTRGEDSEGWARRYLEGVVPRPGTDEADVLSGAGHLWPPDEWIPEAWLAELYADGVGAGNARSLALLQARVARADRDLEAARVARARLAAAEAELATLRTQAAAGRALAEARGERDAARARVAELETSTSWRLTAPLRALARRFKG